MTPLAPAASSPCPACGGTFPGDAPDDSTVCRCGIWAAAPCPLNAGEPMAPTAAMTRRDAQICRLYADPTILIADIAARFNLSAPRISQIARKNNLPLRCPTNAPKRANGAEIREDFLDGMDKSAIAAKHGVVLDTVTYHLRAAGLIPPPVPRAVARAASTARTTVAA
ncbi:hypothetical protein GCM10022252_76110 [Streptosporangium oxazolinicum]|uniref:Uncharacterized protein n=1 Tax=Streptosporangium oxazolinicum TaxID=909287 RepID=A0ABP8BMB0_9ACTN